MMQRPPSLLPVQYDATQFFWALAFFQGGPTKPLSVQTDMDPHHKTLSRLRDAIQTARADPASHSGALQVVERLASHLSSGPSTASSSNKQNNALESQVAAQRLALARLAHGAPLGSALLQRAGGGKTPERLARDASEVCLELSGSPGLLTWTARRLL